LRENVVNDRKLASIASQVLGTIESLIGKVQQGLDFDRRSAITQGDSATNADLDWTRIGDDRG
jgi:hypothetical protein